MKILIINSPTLTVQPYFSTKGLTITEDHLDLPDVFPLNLVSTHVDTDGTMQNFYSPDCIKTIRGLIKPNQYHAVLFCYDERQYPTIGVSGGFTEVNNDIYLGTWLCTVRLSGAPLYAIHELFHTFTHKLERMGYPVNDIMDMTPVNGKLIPFYKNDAPFDPDSNYGRQWALIEPYKQFLEAPTPILRYGQRNLWITMYQKQLEQLGYIFPAYGLFAGITKRAVLDIQKKNGLTQDAIVGYQTLAVSVLK